MKITKIEPAVREWQPFPLDTIPYQLRQYIKEVSASIGIDNANTAASVLSIVSGVIGRTYQLEIKPGHREHTALWVALIADSGLGKSPALNKAREPIDRLQREASDTYKQDLAAYDDDLEEYHRQARKKTDTAGLLQKPVEPALLRYSVSDTTTEALVTILSDNPYGVCLIRDEIAAFFRGLDAYRTGKVDRQVYIEMHGGYFVQSDRKTGSKYIAASTPSVSIIGGIQKDVFREVIRSEPDFMSTGFGARFLMVYPPPEPVLWNDNFVNPAILSSYNGLIDTLYRNREHCQVDENVVRLSPPSWTLIKEFHNQRVSNMLNIDNANIRTFESKTGMHCARLALVLHIIKCTETGGDALTPVTAETMSEAIVLTEWFLNEARRIYAMLDGEEGEPDYRQTVLGVLTGKGTALTKRDIMRAAYSCQRLDKEGKLDGLLNELVKEGAVRRSENGIAIKYEICR